MEAAPFFGFDPAMPALLAGLEANNSRGWFGAHKADYDRLVARPMAALAEGLGPTMAALDPNLRKSLSRPHRDIRFAKDKRPYRSEAWFAYHRSVPEWTDSPAFFFEVSPTFSRWGMGFYSARPATMAALREMAGRRADAFADALAQASAHSLAVAGEQYRRAKPVPEGIGPGVAEIFRRRNFYVEYRDPDAGVTLDGGIERRLVADFQALAPLYRLFLSLWRHREE